MGPSRLAAPQGFGVSRQSEVRMQQWAVVGSGTSDEEWLRGSGSPNAAASPGPRPLPTLLPRQPLAWAALPWHRRNLT